MHYTSSFQLRHPFGAKLAVPKGRRDALYKNVPLRTSVKVAKGSERAVCTDTSTTTSETRVAGLPKYIKDGRHMQVHVKGCKPHLHHRLRLVSSDLLAQSHAIQLTQEEKRSTAMHKMLLVQKISSADKRRVWQEVKCLAQQALADATLERKQLQFLEDWQHELLESYIALSQNPSALRKHLDAIHFVRAAQDLAIAENKARTALILTELQSSCQPKAPQSDPFVDYALSKIYTRELSRLHATTRSLRLSTHIQALQLKHVKAELGATQRPAMLKKASSLPLLAFGFLAVKYVAAQPSLQSVVAIMKVAVETPAVRRAALSARARLEHMKQSPIPILVLARAVLSILVADESYDG